jgi:hypothetical protein
VKEAFTCTWLIVCLPCNTNHIAVSVQGGAVRLLSYLRLNYSSR